MWVVGDCKSGTLISYTNQRSLMAEKEPAVDYPDVSILNGTAVWSYDKKKATSTVTVLPGYLSLRSTNKNPNL